VSAGQDDTAARPDQDCAKLAPRFQKAVEAAILECVLGGLDAYVFEAYRSQALQAAYYARGRSVVPPDRPVTNAPRRTFSVSRANAPSGNSRADVERIARCCKYFVFINFLF